MTNGTTRPEHDLLGDIPVPNEAGANLAFIRALVAVKQTAAATNRDLGLLENSKARAIIAACPSARPGLSPNAAAADAPNLISQRLGQIG